MNINFAKFQLCMNVNDDKINTFIVENESAMSDIIFDIYKQTNSTECKVNIYQDEKALNMSTDIRLILNPFAVDLNDKQIIKSLYLQIAEVGNENAELSAKVNADFINFLDRILLSISDSNIVYDLNLNMESFLKSYNVHFYDEYDDISEKLEEYIRLETIYGRVKLFIFVNLKSYLSIDSLNEFKKMIMYYNAKVLLIESREREEIERENCTIIDKDLCIIKK